MSLTTLNSQNQGDNIPRSPAIADTLSLSNPSNSSDNGDGKTPKRIQINESSNTVFKINDYEKSFNFNERSLKNAGTGRSLRGDFETWLNNRKDKSDTINTTSNIEQTAKQEQIIKLVNRIDTARSAVAAELAYQQEKEIEFKKMKEEKMLQRQKQEGNTSSGGISAITNIFQAPMNINLSESVDEKREKVEKFEKFLGLDGMRVSLYIPIADDNEESKSSAPQQSRAKLVVIRYEKYGDNLVFENKIQGQYQRLKISVVDDIASINKGYGSSMTPAFSAVTEDRSTRFINIQLVGKPELNIEFQNLDRREVAYREFTRLVEVKKLDASSSSSTSSPIRNDDNVSSFMKSSATTTKLEASFYNNTIKANKSLHIAALWFKWLRFIMRDAYSSSQTKKAGQPVFSFGSATSSRERLVVISTGGVASYFKLHDDIKDENIALTLSKFKRGMWDKQVLYDYGYVMEGSFNLNSIQKMTVCVKGSERFCLELLFRAGGNETILNIAFDNEEARTEVRKAFEDFGHSG